MSENSMTRDKIKEALLALRQAQLQDDCTEEAYAKIDTAMHHIAFMVSEEEFDTIMRVA